jgi:hypothetical protein
MISLLQSQNKTRLLEIRTKWATDSYMSKTEVYFWSRDYAAVSNLSKQARKSGKIKNK